MPDFHLRVISVAHSTCDECYRDTPMTIGAISEPCIESQLPTAESQSNAAHEPVTLRFRDLLMALMQSKMKQLAWIDDFQDDPVVVTRDLYEVIIALQQFRRAS
ncbi:MAG: hypothetical protein ACK5OB_10960 [Pirellula sp.]